MTVDEIRRRNLRALVTAEGGSTAFANRIGRTQKYVSQLISARTDKALGKTICRHIETVLGLSRGWLDSPQWDEDETHDPAMLTVKVTPREAKVLEALRRVDDRTKNIVDAVLAASDEQGQAKDA